MYRRQNPKSAVSVSQTTICLSLSSIFSFFSISFHLVFFLVLQTIYSFLQKPADDLYQNISRSVSVAPATKTIGQDVNFTQNCMIYENIQTKVKTGFGFSSADLQLVLRNSLINYTLFIYSLMLCLSKIILLH